MLAGHYVRLLFNWWCWCHPAEPIVCVCVCVCVRVCVCVAGGGVVGAEVAPAFPIPAVSRGRRPALVSASFRGNPPGEGTLIWKLQERLSLNQLLCPSGSFLSCGDHRAGAGWGQWGPRVQTLGRGLLLSPLCLLDPSPEQCSYKTEMLHSRNNRPGCYLSPTPYGKRMYMEPLQMWAALGAASKAGGRGARGHWGVFVRHSGRPWV